jgi:hypothetical protein
MTKLGRIAELAQQLMYALPSELPELEEIRELSDPDYAAEKANRDD